MRDLADWSLNKLLRQPNFGKKSLSDLTQAISGALIDGPLYEIHSVVDSSEDPCRFAREVPNWFAETAIDSLQLTVRAKNIYRVVGIKTVRELANWNADDLMVQPGFGRSSLRATMHALKHGIENGPPVQTSPALLNSRTKCLLDEIRESLMSFSARQRDVLVRR